MADAKILVAFEKIVALLNKMEGTINSNPTAVLLLDELYEVAVGKYRPIIKAAPQMADKVATDLTPIINSLFKIRNAVLKDEEFCEAIDELNDLRAKLRFKALKAYENAGFKRNEAFALIIQDAANAKAMLNNFSEIINRKNQ